MDYSTSDYLLANPLALKSHSEIKHTRRTNQKVPFCRLLWLQGCLNFNIPPPDSHFSVWQFQFEPTNLVKSSFKIKIWFPPSTTRGTCTRLWEPLFSSIPVYTFQVYLFLSWYHFFFFRESSQMFGRSKSHLHYYDSTSESHIENRVLCDISISCCSPNKGNNSEVK